jgi:hypothetical protein
MSWLLWPSSGCSHTLLMMLCAPFQSWTSLTSHQSSNPSGTWIRLTPTSLALHLLSLLHQHLPDHVPKCPPLHRPLPPPLTLIMCSSWLPQMQLLLSPWPCKGQVLPQGASHVQAQPPSLHPQIHPDPPQNASVASTSALSSSALQPDSHTSWNADTGALAHMTSLLSSSAVPLCPV